MAHAESKTAVIAALIGNSLIAITKFAAAGLTGSSAMLSEGIHSVVDTGNQVLMLHGMRRSQLPADERHPFGYGPELYFWAFIVAILLFSIGAGVSFYEGIIKTIDPHPIRNVYMNYIVLGLAAVFEMGSWWFAFRAFRRRLGSRSYWQAVHESKDPALLTVLFEDSAAIIGLLLAFLGVGLSQLLEAPVFDGLASIAIGTTLALTAIVLAIETKGLLIGESAGSSVREGIATILAGQKNVVAVNEVLTMHMGPEDVLLNLSLDFADSLSSAEVEATISDLERLIKSAYPEIKRVFIEAQSRGAHRAAAAIEEPNPQASD
jgi:cation diffusion facilitator family transporter